MATIPPRDNVEDTIGSKLDEEIDALRAQVKELKSRRSIQVSNIISSRASSSLLARLQASYPVDPSLPSPTTVPDDSNPLHQALLERSKQQLSRNRECLYRTCAGITTFKVQDPDPFAVDHGRVLGIRIEAFSSGKYMRPYYVFVNKPYKGSQLFRIHRHTVPPCIPLAALAAKYLHTPSTSADLLKARKQDFPRFMRCLRREVANYHNRVVAIAGLREAFGLGEERGSEKGKGREKVVTEICAADAEAKQVRIEWTDGRIGRIVVDSRGEIQKCVITGEGGRDRQLERRVLEGQKRIEDLSERLGLVT